MEEKEISPVEKSNMYKEWQLEKEEISKFRWLESEKVGYDIGQFRAEWIWWTTRARSWKQGIRESGIISSEQKY